jgi:hypothetical protein
MRALGHSLASLTWEEWITQLTTATPTAAPGSALPAAALLIGNHPPQGARSEIPALGDETALPAHTGITCPPIGPDLIDRTLTFLGLPTPPRRIPRSTGLVRQWYGRSRSLAGAGAAEHHE